MNTMGKKNLIFGFAYLFLTLSLGLYMAFAMFGSGAPDQWLESPQHALIKQAHVHGNLEAVLNIITGLLICLFGSATPRLARTASWLLIIGALLHSGLFYLGGLGLTMVVRLAFVGPLFLLAGLALMLPLLSRGVTLDAPALKK